MASLLFRQLLDPQSSTYTYLLADSDTREALLIDPVFEQHARDTALLRELGLTLRWTLETHTHADHVTSAWLLSQSHQSKIAVAQVSEVSGGDRELEPGDTIELGAASLEVRATPGHTNGCLTFVSADHSRAFTGDALLIRGAGRTDFQQGDPAVLYRSIHEQIFSLPDECLIFPGHDYRGLTATTVAEERAHNPRVGGRASVEDFAGYMRNLGLAHPRQIDVAVPANLRCGQPEDGKLPAAPDWAPVVHTFAGVPEVETEWLATHRAKVHVLDVRGADEAREFGLFPGAQILPLDDLRNRIGEVPSEQPVVVVCRSGRRSAQASTILKQAGVERVASLKGGLLEWLEQGRKLS